MIGCILLAFALCNVGYYPQQVYQPVVYQAQPLMYYQPAPVMAFAPVAYYPQPYYPVVLNFNGGGYRHGYRR